MTDETSAVNDLDALLASDPLELSKSPRTLRRSSRTIVNVALPAKLASSPRAVVVAPPPSPHLPLISTPLAFSPSLSPQSRCADDHPDAPSPFLTDIPMQFAWTARRWAISKPARGCPIHHDRGLVTAR